MEEKYYPIMRRITGFIANVAMILLLSCGNDTCTGQPTVHYDAIGPPDTGTLNLLLANRRGYVVGADSRRTRLVPRTYWDDSQKLFRVGPKSAMVIAGFASWAAQGSPLDLVVLQT
jgi:hypothetical protein